MLETRNLKKVYKTKKGVSVTALNDVSIKFPEKGLVFLLGKSGSGKSTLINLIPRFYDATEGEILREFHLKTLNRVILIHIVIHM